MTKLLSANFLRLRKSNTFWGSLGVCVGLGILSALDGVSVIMDNGSEPLVGAATLEVKFFQYAAFIGILAAEFIALFLGTEYSDGAIRNKIAVGHSRLSIYFANLITGFTASALCMAAYMVSCLAVGAPLLGWFTKPSGLILTAIAGSVVMLAAFCAIFTFVTMNISRKSTSVMVCLLGVFLLFMLAIYLCARLEAPEFVENYTLSVNGQVTASVPEPNPQFLQPAERVVYQFVYDLLPTGQAVQYCSLLFTAPARLMGLAAAVTALFTGAGAALFRRKDLK